jgi:hypothetical protein
MNMIDLTFNINKENSENIILVIFFVKSNSIIKSEIKRNAIIALKK